MSEDRREYPLIVHFNDRRFTRALIDPHYEKKHSDLTDELILKLLGVLDGKQGLLEGLHKGFEFYPAEILWHRKAYRLILTYCDEDFLGVVNAFRVKRKKL